jgi:hypothetical protein
MLTKRLLLLAALLTASCGPTYMSDSELKSQPIGPFPDNYKTVIADYFKSIPSAPAHYDLSEPKPGRIFRGNRGYGMAWEFGYLTFATADKDVWQFIIRDGQVRYAVPP